MNATRRALDEFEIMHHRRFRKVFLRNTWLSAAGVGWSLAWYWFNWRTANSYWDLLLVAFFALLVVLNLGLGLKSFRLWRVCGIKLRHYETRISA